MSIIISQEGEKTQKVDKQDIENEDYLQKYIKNNPESIPVYEIEEDKKLLVVAREFRTESGRIDVLAIDKDGDIYVVETKLYPNSDKRMVVAQALDYGASLWRHADFDEFMAKIDSAINNEFKISFEEKAKDFFGIDDEQIASVVASMKDNLEDGNIKFVILMDVVDERLKDLIVYINQNSKFDIYAVQMEYYKFENKFDKYEIMIPKLFGAEVKKSLASSSGSRIIRNWTQDEFLPDAKNKISGEIYQAVEKLFNFCSEHTSDFGLGNGSGTASISPIFNKLSASRGIFCLKSSGTLGFKIGWMLERDVDEEGKKRTMAIAERLKAIGISPAFGASVSGGDTSWVPKVDDIIAILKEYV